MFSLQTLSGRDQDKVLIGHRTIMPRGVRGSASVLFETGRLVRPKCATGSVTRSSVPR